MASTQKLISVLANKIDPSLLRELLSEYREAKEGNWLQDWEKSILHAARFSELVMAAIINITEHRVLDINKLAFNSLQNLILNKPKKSPEEEILTLVIPKVAASVYSIRNKKRVAHVKAIDPDFLDSLYCMSACDWILSQLVMLVHSSNPAEAKMLIDSIVEKRLPFIEEFEDGSVMVLREDLKFADSVLGVLYHFYPARLTNGELERHVKPRYSQLLTTTLANLEKKKTIHRNLEGSKLTKVGIRHVERAVSSQST